MKAELESLKNQKADLWLICAEAEKDLNEAREEAQQKQEEVISLQDIVGTIEEEVENAKQIFQDALGILLIAHKAGRATDGDYKTLYESCGIDLPEHLQPAPDQEDAEEDPNETQRLDTGT
jgi:D-alanine-D-alanine ligase-like ATP-grasp enzyme